MKKLCLSSVCLLLISFTVSSAAPTLTIISVTHTVSGKAGPNSYALSDNVPVSGSAYYNDPVYGPMSASSSAGYFVVNASGWGEGEFFRAYAENEYFLTHSAGVTLSFTGNGQPGHLGGEESRAGFSFYDVTDGFEIDSHLWQAGYSPEPWPPGWSCDFVKFYTIAPSHQYQLRFWAETIAHEGGKFDSMLNASIQPIPAPSSVLLAMIGVGIFADVKRWFR
jgi:hypothetical protein